MSRAKSKAIQGFVIECNGRLLDRVYDPDEAAAFVRSSNNCGDEFHARAMPIVRLTYLDANGKQKTIQAKVRKQSRRPKSLAAQTGGAA